MLWVGGARHPKGVVFFRFKCWGLSLHEGNGLRNWEICFWWKLSRTKVCKLRTGWAKAAHSPANQNDSFNVLQRKLCRTHRALLQASLILTAANHAISSLPSRCYPSRESDIRGTCSVGHPIGGRTWQCSLTVLTLKRLSCVVMWSSGVRTRLQHVTTPLAPITTHNATEYCCKRRTRPRAFSHCLFAS
jgi:hypothetical protein